MRAALFLLSTLFVLISAKSRVNDWGSTSRLASVQSLVDFRTWAIDESVFGKRTKDKIFVDGHFYSDKTPTPALYLAGIYSALQFFFGLRFSENAALLIYLLVLFSSGIAFLLSVWNLWRLSENFSFSDKQRFVFVGSFAFCTYLAAYSRNLNQSILFLAASSFGWRFLFELSKARSFSFKNIFKIGFSTGIAYAIDTALGGILAILMMVYLLNSKKNRDLKALGFFVLSFLPFFLIHHFLNYRIGGTFAPAGTVSEYLNWPGGHFRSSNATGYWNHSSLAVFFIYAFKMLFGYRGFFTHNLPALLFLPCLYQFVREKRYFEKDGIFFSLSIVFMILGWLLYAALSVNYSGKSASIRWFVPFLFPIYSLMAFSFQKWRKGEQFFYLLSFVGLGLSGAIWLRGPAGEISKTTLMSFLAVAAIGLIALRLSRRLQS